MQDAEDSLSVTSDTAQETLDRNRSVYIEAAYFYFISYLVPDRLLQAVPDDDQIALSKILLVEALSATGGEPYEPATNPALVLILTLAVLDRYKPALGYAQPQIGPGWIGYQDRVPSVELAEELRLLPRQLARVMREVGVEAQTKRFEHRGVTRGYLRVDVRAAWERTFTKVLAEAV